MNLTCSNLPYIHYLSSGNKHLFFSSCDYPTCTSVHVVLLGGTGGGGVGMTEAWPTGVTVKCSVGRPIHAS